MGLLNFKKPKWQSKDAEKRLSAVRKLDPEQADVLLSIAREDQEKEIRLAAISRISDIEAIQSLADEDMDSECQTAVSSQLDGLLYKMILGSDDPEHNIDALNKVQDTEIIAKIAVGAESSAIRTAAIKKVSDQNVLAEIIKQKCGREPALCALEKIDDEKLLAELSDKAASKAARRKAEEKLAEIEAKNFKPDPKVQQEEKLSELLVAASNLVLTKDWDKAAERLVALNREWGNLDTDGTHKLNGDFSKACKAFEDQYRTICERRKEEQEKATKFHEQQAQLDDICSTIESLITSADDDSDHRFNTAVSQWESSSKTETFKAVATESMKERFAKCCESYQQGQKKIREEKNVYKSFEEKITEAKKLIGNDKIRQASKLFEDSEKNLSSVKFKYVNASEIKKHLAELKTLLDEKMAETLAQTIKSRTDLCERLEALITTDKQARAERKMKNIRQEWHNLPHIDDDEGRALEKRFSETLDKFTEKQKSIHHDREWQGWANLTIKEKLLAKAEGLGKEEELAVIFDTVKELQKEWKSTGPVPRNVAQKLWERFHAACDINYERCAPYREELKSLKKEAEKKREEICIRAEELANSTQWRKTAEELKSLQSEWKGLLKGRRHEEEKLYRRFRKACNIFFDRRHKDYESQEEIRLENLGKKEALCEEAEQLAEEPELDKAEKFRDLQLRWKKIGHVPRKSEDAIWKRFRAACDTFFTWLDEQRLENLKQKEDLCKDVGEILASITEDSDRKEISAQLTTLQEKWKEIGPVPADQKDSIWKKFHDPCDAFFKAQREHFKEIEAKRLEIQELKEDYLLQAEELGSRGTDKETTNLMKELQKKWNEAGRASREVEKDLNLRFKDICDSFFEGRRQHFSDLEQERLDNLKKRERLCLRLENIVGTASESVNKGRDKALSLAEELKLAMEENFIMAGRRNDKKAVSDEVKKIQQDWKKIGPVPREHDKKTRARFTKALDTYYKDKVSNNK